MLNENTNLDFLINPNPESAIFKEVSDVIRKNGNYCCCAITKEPDTMCMCKDFREQQESGFCHCNRFFKVKNIPIITILCAPQDYEYSIGLAESLTVQGLNVLLPFYRDPIYHSLHEGTYRENIKAQIYKADMILVINSSEDAVEYLAEYIMWAEDLQKKILYETMEEVKNED